MIEIKKVGHNDETMWDAYVDASPSATPYHRYAWGKAVKGSYGFDIVYLGAFENDKIVGVLPLVKMGFPCKQKKLISLPYCDGASAIGDKEEIVDLLISYANNTLQSKAKIRLELRSAKTKVVPSEELNEGQKVRMLLSLAASPDEQMAVFKSKLRSQIRKAEKNGLTSTVHSFDGTPDFDEVLSKFYNVFAGNMRLLGSPVHSKAWFQAVLREYSKNAYLTLVHKDNDVIGGAIVLLNNVTASIPWASTDAKYNRLAPNMLMYWTVISHAITTGAAVFDFGRSSVNEGTYNFKKQWGSQPAPLQWLNYHNGVKQEHLDIGKSKARYLVEGIWRKLPLFFVNFVGPKVRKFVSL